MNNKLPEFSIILPTYNRSGFIERAVNSVICQSYDKWELLIIDDGSSDETDKLCYKMYEKEILSGKIRYIKCDKNYGIAHSRNIGIAHAKNNWIAYLDSDNEMSPKFLETYAECILNNPEYKTFYSQVVQCGKVVGMEFDFAALCNGNYIDQGVFVHDKSIVQYCGGYDENLKRLIDWDFIIRCTKKYTPYFIKDQLLIYSDKNDYPRVTNTENLDIAHTYIRNKIKTFSKISVIVPIYNALDDVKIMLKSLRENFNFDMGEVYLINDCSNSTTSNYLRNFCKFDSRFKLLENETNLGFIKTCNKGMKLATGEYIVLLNSDTKIPKGFCERIIDCFNSDSEIGIASPIASCSLTYYIPLSLFSSLECVNKRLRKQHIPIYPLIPSGEGFCYCIRRNVINSQGYLDEIFGKGYHEEVDYSYRAIQNGWKNVLIDNLYVYHKRQASFGAEEREKLIEINNEEFKKRWSGFCESYTRKNNITNPIPLIKRDLYSPFSIRNIFSITNLCDNDKIFKVITFMGIKLKIRNKKKEFENKINQCFENQKMIIDKITQDNNKLKISINNLCKNLQNIQCNQNEKLDRFLCQTKNLTK